MGQHLDYHARCDGPPVGIDLEEETVHFIADSAAAERVLKRKQSEVEFYKRQSRRYRTKVRELAYGAMCAILVWIMLEESNRSGNSLFSGRAPCVCDENTMFVIQAVNQGDKKSWVRKTLTRILPGFLVIALFFIMLASMNTERIDNNVFMPEEDEDEESEEEE